MDSIDVKGVVPEARSAAEAASRIWLRRLEPWFIGLLVHGSAVKGGFIPNGSDIDFQLYLEDGAFERDGILPIKTAIAVHRELAAIDVRPFQYIQCYPRQARLSTGARNSTGPIPGTYHMIAGSLPVLEATEHEVVDGARARLSTLEVVPFRLANKLFEHGGGRLERQVRYLCTDVWPTLYSVLTLREPDPLAVWRLPKDMAISLLHGEPLGSEAERFFELAHSYYTGGESVEGGLAVIEQGLRVLRGAKEWWAAQ